MRISTIGAADRAGVDIEYEWDWVFMALHAHHPDALLFSIWRAFDHRSHSQSQDLNQLGLGEDAGCWTDPSLYCEIGVANITSIEASEQMIQLFKFILTTVALETLPD